MRKPTIASRSTASSTQRRRAALALAAALLVPTVVLAACDVFATPDTGTHGPTSGSAAVGSPVETSAGPTLAATASPTASASPTAAATPTPGVTASPTPPTACVTSVASSVAPSDRLTKVSVASGVGVDKITFTFGSSSGQPSGTDPTGRLRPTSPPFSLSGSGAPVDIAGHRFIAVTFRGMALADEQGNPTYGGPNDIRPLALAVRELRLVDSFEGVVTWIVGVNGPGCVAVTRLTGPSRIVVSVTQP